jgi:glyoxylase-like metal-dependent hydrolase (beta-lactamase superfamily II)
LAVPIIRIRLRISWAYLLLAERPVLVDTGSAGEEGRIVRALRRHGVEPGSLAMLLHTHAHTDHAGSTRALQERYKIPAAVHPADLEKMRSGDSSPLIPLRFFSRVLLQFLNPLFPAATPDLLVEEGYSLRQLGIPATVVHTPGHTPGSISVLFDDGRAITGDLLMGGYLGGYILPSAPNYHYYAEDLSGIRSSIRNLLDRGAMTFYPGHGGPLDAVRVRQRFEPEFSRG